MGDGGMDGRWMDDGWISGWMVRRIDGWVGG